MPFSEKSLASKRLILFMVLLLWKSFCLMIRSCLDAGRFSIAKSILCQLMRELVILSGPRIRSTCSPGDGPVGQGRGHHHGDHPQEDENQIAGHPAPFDETYEASSRVSQAAGVPIAVGQNVVKLQDPAGKEVAHHHEVQ